MAKTVSNQEITPDAGVTRGRRPVEPKVPPSIGGKAGRDKAGEILEWKAGLEEKIEDLKERGSQTITELRQDSSEAYAQAKANVSAWLEHARATSAEVAERTRIRARSIVENYPLHLLAGIAGLAFVAGVLLRTWRSSHHE